LTYARDGDDYLVVASNGGRPDPPTWLGNLKSRAECEIRRRSQYKNSVCGSVGTGFV
jgi:hypothetical protein